MSDADAEGSAPAVLFEERGAVAVIRLARPAERNPLSVSTLSELEQAFSSYAPRSDVRVVVFTGTADVFASGANIRELQSLSYDGAREFARRGQQLFRSISDARQLTVAAVNGYCLGGGLDLALACSLRVASPRATFAHPGARLGIITGWGGTQRLPRLIGAPRALELFATARRLTAEEAHEIGLVDILDADPLARACALAEKL